MVGGRKVAGNRLRRGGRQFAEVGYVALGLGSRAAAADPVDLGGRQTETVFNDFVVEALSLDRAR